jgi:hypothetical protein
MLKRMQRLLLRLLQFRPGAAAYILGGIVLFSAMALFTQYKVKGRIDVPALVDRDARLQPFWQRNPRLQYLDSFPRSSLLMVRDTQTGMSAMLDSAVVINAEVRPTSCPTADGLAALLPPRSANLVCFQLIKPDTGAGVSYTRALSFQAKEKDVDVAQFYRALFQSRGNKVTTIVESSRGIILEAENARGDALARVATRSPFNTATAFFAWTQEFANSPR